MIAMADDVKAKLARLRVEVEMKDRNTLVLRNVPANQDYFNKAHTNLLVMRPQPGFPFVVCADEDMEYTGTDPLLVQAFSGGQKQSGWRVLFMTSDSQPVDTIIQQALCIVGVENTTPRFPAAHPSGETSPREGLLASYGTDLSLLAKEDRLQATYGRSEEITQIVSTLLGWSQERLPLIVGASGVGKTNLLGGVAHRLLAVCPSMRLVSVDIAILWAGTFLSNERESLLATLLKEAADTETALALERIDLIHTETTHGLLQLAQTLDRGVRIIGTTFPEHAVQIALPPLARRLHVVELSEPSAADTLAILKMLRPSIAQHHQVEIDEACLPFCLRVTASLPGYYPAKALSVLAAAASRASLTGMRFVGPDDIFAAAVQRERTTWSSGESQP